MAGCTAAAKHPENPIINPDVVQPAIRQVDAFVTLLPRVCRSLRSLLNSRLTTFNPRRARVVPVLADSNIFPYLKRIAQLRFSGLESVELIWWAGTKVRQHALSLPAGARRVEDGGTLSHGSSAAPPHAWAENCTPRSAGSLFCTFNRLHHAHNAVQIRLGTGKSCP